MNRHLLLLVAIAGCVTSDPSPRRQRTDRWGPSFADDLASQERFAATFPPPDVEHESEDCLEEPEREVIRLKGSPPSTPYPSRQPRVSPERIAELEAKARTPSQPSPPKETQEEEWSRKWHESEQRRHEAEERKQASEEQARQSDANEFIRRRDSGDEREIVRADEQFIEDAKRDIAWWVSNEVRAGNDPSLRVIQARYDKSLRDDRARWIREERTQRKIEDKLGGIR